MLRPSVLQQPVASSSTSHGNTSARAQQPRYSPYTPSIHELHPGPRNRLFLALRSGLPSEVDWALPRLVAGSYDALDHFKLETWIDSVGALQYWPERWIDGLEVVSASHAIRSGTPAPKAVQATVPEWTLDPAVEKRATESLLVLRNASFGPNNSKLICRATFLGLLDRFFALPLDFLVDVLASYPETVSHILTILSNILPHLHPSRPVLAIFANVLPVLLVQSRDAAMIQLLLPILITTATLPHLPPLPDDLIPHLLMLISTRPASPLLDLLLDALLTLSSLPAYSRQILSNPDLGRYLKTLVPILRHGATPYNAQWDSSHLLAGKTVRNPASSAGVAEAASQRRAAAREDAQAKLDRGERVEADVGDKMPVLSETIKARLYAMPEPKRSIAWMHETFVYSSSSQLLQVTFWHAYRDFFTHPSTKEQLLSASEVIKNVTVAFPGASAKIWVDETGAQKFVIAGMGFRKGSDDDDRFACRWRDCTGSKHSSPASLLNHVTTHLLPPPTFCGWGSCPSLFSTTHVLTHIPSLKRPAIPEHITLHPSLPTNAAHSPRPTSLPPAPLPRSVKLAFTATRTDTDAQHKPAGPAFLAALILRHLARSLRLEIAVDAPELIDREEAGAKRKHLVEERYGLPIPESVLREEEEEERNATVEEEEGMNLKERLLAQRAFESVEEGLLKVMEENMSGLGMYLGETVGW